MSHEYINFKEREEATVLVFDYAPILMNGRLRTGREKEKQHGNASFEGVFLCGRAIFRQFLKILIE